MSSNVPSSTGMSVQLVSEISKKLSDAFRDIHEMCNKFMVPSQSRSNNQEKQKNHKPRSISASNKMLKTIQSHNSMKTAKLGNKNNDSGANPIIVDDINSNLVSDNDDQEDEHKSGKGELSKGKMLSSKNNKKYAHIDEQAEQDDEEQQQVEMGIGTGDEKRHSIPALARKNTKNHHNKQSNQGDDEQWRKASSKHTKKISKNNQQQNNKVLSFKKKNKSLFPATTTATAKSVNVNGDVNQDQNVDVDKQKHHNKKNSQQKHEGLNNNKNIKNMEQQSVHGAESSINGCSDQQAAQQGARPEAALVVAANSQSNKKINNGNSKMISHKPKAPTSSFLLFFKEQQHQIAKSYPNYGVVELTRVAAKCWNDLSVEEKDPYQKIFQEERKKYQKAMEKYRKEFPQEIKQKELMKKEKKKQKAMQTKDKSKALKQGNTVQANNSNNGNVSTSTHSAELTSARPLPIGGKQMPIQYQKSHYRESVSEYGNHNHVPQHGYFNQNEITPGGPLPFVKLEEQKAANPDLQKAQNLPGNNAVFVNENNEILNPEQRNSLPKVKEQFESNLEDSLMNVLQVNQNVGVSKVEEDENSLGEDI